MPTRETPGVSVRRQWVTGRPAPVYRLLFDFAPFGLRAQHAIELIYLFQRTGVYPTSLVTVRESDAFAERTMLELWTTFAHTGAPPPGAGWPTFEADTERYLRLGDGETSVGAELHREACALFDPVFE